MAIFKCVGYFYFHIPEGICFAGFLSFLHYYFVHKSLLMNCILCQISPVPITSYLLEIVFNITAIYVYVFPVLSFDLIFSPDSMWIPLLHPC
jgi:hypothetical protein